MDDDQLLRQCQHGDTDALAELVRRFQDRIYRLAVRVLQNPESAQEATADVMVKIWSKSRQWRGDAKAATWIYRLAIRTILDTRRRRQRWLRRWFASLTTTIEDGTAGPDQKAEQDEQRSLIHSAVARLKDEDRVLVHLYYFENQTLPEIATVLDVPSTTLKMRLARARQKLRDMLGDLFEHE